MARNGRDMVDQYSLDMMKSFNEPYWDLNNANVSILRHQNLITILTIFITELCRH
jgi:hypothetical protein